MANLVLRNLQKSYADVHIIKDFNLAVEEGEMLVVVGPSGCGKSTLLRLIAGLEEVSGGEIFIKDKKVNRLEPKDRNIAMVFQNYALYPHMTVFNNMAYGLKRRKRPKEEIAKRVAKTASILGLEDLLDRKPHQLSGGQRQRVAMGRAIVRKPTIFLFDEPLSNLDANLRAQMRIEIRKLHQELKTTSLYVTHDQVEAMTLADRLAVLNKGQIEQIGTPAEIYQTPSSQFVAGFMGSPPMNFLNAKINDMGNAIQLHGGTLLPFHEDTIAARKGQPIVLGIRPENIVKAHKQGADRFDIDIHLVESLGAEQLIHGRFPGDKQTLVLRLPTKIKTHAVGERITLGVMPDSLHLFDPQSKLRVA
ncbi:MAG: sn-glycerol-3-phosphate ABC transporter ATP-binding protein UgpC [Pseudomonadota bacterium]